MNIGYTRVSTLDQEFQMLISGAPAVRSSYANSQIFPSYLTCSRDYRTPTSMRDIGYMSARVLENKSSCRVNRCWGIRLTRLRSVAALVYLYE
jgi:hypothetical protein